MRTDTAPAFRLEDYRPFPFAIETVRLRFVLDAASTLVAAAMTVRRTGDGPLVLDGEALDLETIAIDGNELAIGAYTQSDTTLSIDSVPDAFTLTTRVRISPEKNTALSGLYVSGGRLCTQCEAAGFRRITYWPDRPDVMSRFSVRLEADKSRYPILLSNGTPGETGELEAGRHFAEWDDPHPKPSYLFALCAGDYDVYQDTFTTRSGQSIGLAIHVDKGDADRAAYAMDALKRSMRWDEDVFGREYDLGVFNIVAVRDFNFGAMENKGLNIFNSAYVLADEATATDMDFEAIESIVAHEYFHNWTGNRITCRDWFQLCLKEGLTVFRDQSFMADMRSAAVQRIGDVLALRARQFREDAGPLAHPVRPESFVEINNFYTATVYEKGAEVIGMLRTLVGPEGYDTGVQLYFDRHDGQACTIEDWLACFEEACETDLSQFKLWYQQAGTPVVTVETSFNDGVYRLDLKQEVPPTPDRAEKAAMVLPLAFGLLDTDGHEMLPTQVHALTDTAETLTFDLGAEPVLSMLRGFYAPVILRLDQTDRDRLTLLAHDTDPFARWEAGRALAKDRLMRAVTDGRDFDTGWLDAVATLARDETADPAFRALALALPSEDDLAGSLHVANVVPDPDAIYAVRRRAQLAMAERLGDDLARLRGACAVPGPYDPKAEDAGKRSFGAAILRLGTLLDGGAAARAAYDRADNMTDRMAAFTCLLESGDPDVAAQFEDQWRHDRLVMDKWFMAQVAHAAPREAVDTVERLMAHADFDAANPNRFRSVIGGLTAGNPAGFHDASGRGYDLLARVLLELDRSNPQTAARMSTAFETWRRYDADRQDLMRGALDRMAQGAASRDLTEMVARMLA
ncbi:MAG: aminopeptidase N [Pseudomonadota bacterium]